MSENIIRKLAGKFLGLGRKLFEIKDRPHAVAGGAAIGIFMGFTPLFGLKTLLCLGASFVLRCNPIAAVVAVSLHDIVTPIWPFLLRIEYDLGYFILSRPHHIPPKLEHHHLHVGELLKWTTFLDLGLPLLVGSLFLAVPFAALTYGVVYFLITRKRVK
ncbi:MAG: hypothetical protein Fur0032_18450 [Terrimicrobiaceae bacterium]